MESFAPNFSVDIPQLNCRILVLKIRYNFLGFLKPHLQGSGQILARMNFVPGPLTSHGSVQILLQIAIVFARLRAHFKTSCFCFVLLPLLSNEAKNIPRFQALITLSGQKVARFGCLHESVRNWNRGGQKVDLRFSGPRLAHLTVQKFVQFRRYRGNARWNRASFCPRKTLPGPV